MFISRKKYKKMNEKIDELRKEIDNYKYKVELKETNIYNLRSKITMLDKIKEDNSDQINILCQDIGKLTKANAELIDWICKIMQEFGTCEVNSRNSFKIPVYRNPVKAAFGKIDEVINEIPQFVSQEEIIIPEIHFIKMK